jgi:hypothetical protein
MLDKIVEETSKLNMNELRQLYNHIGSILGPAVVYQQKHSNCGFWWCWVGGLVHGLYWYAYFTYQGKTHCIYVGKEKREINPLEELEKKKSKRR